MNNGNQNVITTGIAVALALVVVVGLMLFGPNILGIFNRNSSAPASNLATTTMTAQNDQDTSSSSSDSDIASIISQIPPNVTQLMMKDVTVGTGAEAQPGDQVTVNYVGMLTNGQVFDASANHGNQGFTFNLGAGQVIKGWDQGVDGMKVGGTRDLVIPASLGYGSQAVGPIPANSTLVFQVQLLNVQPGSASQPAQ